MASPEPYIGSVDLWAMNWAPQYYANCNGALLPISQYTPLFSLLGTNFGGNGQTTFGLPNMQGRIPIGMGVSPQGTQYILGEVGGAESVTLNSTQMPAHIHATTYTAPSFSAAASGSFSPKAGTGKITLSSDPTNNYPGQTASTNQIYTSANNASMGSNSVNVTVTLNQTSPGSVVVQPAGGNLPFSIIPPFQVLNYIIALQGIFPPRP